MLYCFALPSLPLLGSMALVSWFFFWSLFSNLLFYVVRFLNSTSFSLLISLFGISCCQNLHNNHFRNTGKFWSSTLSTTDRTLTRVEWKPTISSGWRRGKDSNLRGSSPAGFHNNFHIQTKHCGEPHLSCPVEANHKALGKSYFKQSKLTTNKSSWR